MRTPFPQMSLAAWMSLGCLISVFSLGAQELAITDIRLDADHHPVIRFTADPEHYYILYRGDDLAQLAEPVDVVLGGRTDEIRDPSDATFDARFYRVQKVPILTPLDLDGDGIDDVYELERAPWLHPLRALDAFDDFDADYRTNLDEYRRGTDPFLSDIRPPTVGQPVSATASTILQLTGTATPGGYVRVEGGAALATNGVRADGSFTVDISLAPNRLNRLLISTVDTDASTSIGQPIEILQDSQPPTLFLDFPTNSMALSVSEITVAGRVGDALSGYQGLAVWVHSSPSEGPSPLATTSFPADSPLRATVDVGIGSNGTFERGPVPLAEGDNTLTVVSTDALGNRTFRQASVVRRPPQGPLLAVHSGDRQTTNALRRLAQPLVVHARQADGSPLANAILTFEVTRSDGRLLPVTPQALASDWTTQPNANTNGAMRLELRTGATGEAEVWWTLGSDAGCANNRVSVTGAGFDSGVFLAASAIGHPARQINIGSGNHQKAEANALAPEPLRAWTSDGLNPAAGVPVTFRVVQGGGRLVPGGRDGTPLDSNGASSPAGRAPHALPGVRAANGDLQITVLTGVTGHASVGFVAGPSPGLNLIEASFPGQFGLPATFTVYGLTRDLTRAGTFSGLVLDNTSCPVGGAYCELEVANYRVGTFTDLQGRFQFDQVPGGMGHLQVNGATATNLFNLPIPTNSFPSLHYSVLTVANAENSLPAPVLLPRLDPRNAHLYAGTNDLVLTVHGVDGLKMIIAANSMRHPDGTRVTPERPAVVSLNQVHHDDVPMPMPDGVAPPFAWTLQPGGATFDPPVRVEYPNMSGLAPGSIAYFLSFNHDTERFEIVSSGSVSQDGSTIITDPASGLTLAGWGCNCPPYSVTGDCELDCETTDHLRPTSTDTCDEDPCQRIQAILNEQATRFPSVLNNQMACLGRTVCAARLNGEPWADEFILNTLLDAANHPLPGAPTYDQLQRHVDAIAHIPWVGSTLRGLPAFLLQLLAGADHFNMHLAPSFWRHCDQRRDSNHKRFFSDAVVPCLQSIPDLNQLERLLGTVLIPSAADTIADLIEIKCHGFLPNPAGGTAQAVGLATDPLARRVPDVSILTSQAISNLGSLYVTAANGDRFQFAGTAVALKVSLKESEGNQGQELPVDGFTFVIGVSSNWAWVDPSGTLHAVGTPDGTADSYAVVRVLAYNSTHFGVGQFVVVNEDRDGDGLADEWESRVGLDPTRHDDPSSDHDGDGLSTWTEALILTHPLLGDTDGDGKSDTVEVRQYSNPVDPGSLKPFLPAGYTFTLGGQIATSPGFNILHMRNVVASDRYGNEEGPGSRPDFLGDSPTRLLGYSTNSTSLQFAFSEFVNIRQGASVVIRDLTFTDTPPRQAERLEMQAPSSTLRIGTTNQIQVTALYADGSTNDVTRRADWTSYRLSNPRLARITPDGELVPLAPGILFVTAINESATTVLGLNLTTADDRFVTLRGRVLDDQNQPASGVEVRLSGLSADTVVTGADGTFAFPDLPTAVASVNVHAWLSDPAGGGWWAALRDLDLSQGATGNLPPLTLARLTVRSSTQNIAAGRSHSMALRSDGTLWAWGGNTDGQLGTGNRLDQATPIGIAPERRWRAVTAGSQHTVALQDDGNLWAWGVNWNGQIGDGSTIPRQTPTPIQPGTHWLEADAGRSHTVALRSDGTLWTWGFNGEGQLGDGTRSDRPLPGPVQPGSRWRAIAAGGLHTVALREDGRLQAWGNNQFGQLGDGTTIRRLTPTAVQADGRWVAVAAGHDHSLALREDGTLWAWGQNTNGQLGDGTTLLRLRPTAVQPAERWQTVVAGHNHTVALRADGTLWAWGWNGLGQLGDGTRFDRNTPTIIQSNTRFLGVAAGEFHTLALRDDGTLWTWGLSDNGRLGDGTTRLWPSPLPIQPEESWLMVTAGNAHTAAIRTDGLLWAWGANTVGQLGTGTTATHLMPALVDPASRWQVVTAGGNHTAGLLLDGTIMTWGSNSEGQLGDGFTSNQLLPIAIQTGMTWQQLTPGSSGDHTVALQSDGTLWTWGNNNFGQLGDGTTSARSSPTLIMPAARWRAVAIGAHHTLAVNQDGGLWAWGRNMSGQLGDGTTINRLVPKLIQPMMKWRAIAAGISHTVALRDDGTLWTWGNNSDGGLGDGTTTRRLTPTAILPQTKWQAVAAGGNRTMAIRDDATLWTWGSNLYGELGDGTLIPRRTPTAIMPGAKWRAVTAGSQHSMALTLDGKLWGWGNNGTGQLAIPPWRQVAGGAVWGPPEP